VSFICFQLFHHLNLFPYNPSYLSPTVLNIRWQIKPKTYGYEPSVTDISKSTKQIYQKCWATIHEVYSNSIRIGIVVVVHWMGCVCNQSWHVRTCLNNSWHKLQVAAFAQLAVVGHGSNVCLCHSDFTMCESTEQHICIKFCFKIGKTATEMY